MTRFNDRNRGWCDVCVVGLGEGGWGKGGGGANSFPGPNYVAPFSIGGNYFIVE